MACLQVQGLLLVALYTQGVDIGLLDYSLEILSSMRACCLPCALITSLIALPSWTSLLSGRLTLGSQSSSPSAEQLRAWRCAQGGHHTLGSENPASSAKQLRAWRCAQGGHRTLGS